VRDNGMIVGQDIVCTIKEDKIIGGFRSIMSGFDFPSCYIACEDRIKNGVSINKK
jgi:hypothetical protein